MPQRDSPPETLFKYHYVLRDSPLSPLKRRSRRWSAVRFPSTGGMGPVSKRAVQIKRNKNNQPTPIFSREMISVHIVPPTDSTSRKRNRWRSSTFLHHWGDIFGPLNCTSGSDYRPHPTRARISWWTAHSHTLQPATCMSQRREGVLGVGSFLIFPVDPPTSRTFLFNEGTA